MTGPILNRDRFKLNVDPTIVDRFLQAIGLPPEDADVLANNPDNVVVTLQIDIGSNTIKAYRVALKQPPIRSRRQVT